PLSSRLQSILHAPSSASDEAQTARGWVDLAYEAAYGERFASAAAAAERGLAAPGSDDAENRLMLLRVLSGVHEMRGDSEDSARFVRQRVQLLRQLGRTRQADVEAQLGAMLLREPDRVEAEILTRVAEELDENGAPSVERADVLSSLAVHRMHDEGPQAAMPLLSEACRMLEQLQRTQALASAQMFLAHVQLLTDQPEAALATADKVLSAPTNRAVRGAMNMLRATVHHNQDRPQKAAAEAISSAEMYCASDRKSTRLNSSHVSISYAVFCLKKKKHS